MTDGIGGGGTIAFLKEAVGSLLARRMLLPAILLAVLLTATNIVILLHMPVKGQPFPWPFAAAALARLFGLAWFAAAILRILNDSPRPAWRPDGGFWLYAATMLIVTPLGELHGAVNRWLIAGAGKWFWPVALADGALGAIIALLGLALASVAYRRVARS
jgi:hypothetical protein